MVTRLMKSNGHIRLELCEFIGCSLYIFTDTHTQAWFTYHQTGRRRAWPPIKASYSPRHTNADSLQPDHLKHTPYSPQSSGKTQCSII